MNEDLTRALVARLAVVLLVILLGLLFLAGCGSGTSSFALQKDAASVQSFASEGKLLSKSAVTGDSTNAFIAVHAEELSQSADQLAASLASSSQTAARPAAAEEIGRLAGRASRALARLSSSPDDRALAARVSAELAAVARRAAAIQASL